jgi:hypothetical protein|tara:strand:- start:805 stop:1746 length:942 start_codon:yes stop_codon:yes gene_type:complete
MKNIAFHSNQLGIRGTDVALYDYAHYNETILKNKSFIISDKNNDLQALKKFEDRFDVFLYDNFEECFDFIFKNNISDIYYQKYGTNDGKIVPGINNLVHTVFQSKEIHGEKYHYISEWLAKSQNMDNSFVPYIVNIPEPTEDLRSKLNIPDDKIIIGRYGGLNQFDLPFVHKAVYDIVNEREDIVFVFMNTNPFTAKHPNIIHIEGTYELQNKSNYINTCDYMLHGRHRGETFGLAVCEFLFHDKPVISWQGGIDQNHIEILKDRGLIYTDYITLFNILNNLQKNKKTKNYYKELVEEYTPENVMKRFNELFL